MEARLQVGQTVRTLQVNDQEEKFESWGSPIKTNKKGGLAFLLYLITSDKSKFLQQLIKKKSERVGFEPTVTCATLVFKTNTLNHSDISPVHIK